MLQLDGGGGSVDDQMFFLLRQSASICSLETCAQLRNSKSYGLWGFCPIPKADQLVETLKTLNNVELVRFSHFV